MGLAGALLALLARLALLALLAARLAAANVPLFDVATSVRVLLVPADARVGAPLYRLRGTDADFDFPLSFLVAGSAGSPVVAVESYPCSRNHSFCEGSVVLLRPLEPGRVYDVQFKVVDTAGDSTTLDCTIRTSNSSTPTDTIFPHLPQLVTVPEDAPPGTELDYIIVRRNSLNSRHPSLEIQDAPEFVIRQSLASNDTVNGTIVLAAPLDFERKSMYILQIFAIDPYAETGSDTRNVASFKVAVAVQDIQDMPPVFTSAPAVTLLNHSVHEGDVVLTVHAEDGDKGSPREVRYALLAEGNPFTNFFHIDERTGAVRLARPLRQLAAATHVHQPVLLGVLAEEVKTGLQQPPAMSTAVRVALLLGDMGNSPPYFSNDNYVARIEENSPQGTALTFEDPYVTEIRDDDMGKGGVFSIALEGNNGTFEVSPTVGEKRASFVVRVRSSRLLDFEARATLHFTIVARELGPGSGLSASAQVTVYLEDVNDNAPVFERAAYEAILPENMTAGTTVAQVQAEDADTGLFGEVQYTRILGHLNTSLALDSITGLVTVSRNNHKFDRETAPEFRFRVEARDSEGTGNRALVPLAIKLLDVNDETPRFDRELYEFFLTTSQRNFTAPAFIAANDMDAEAPNNMVRYEIISGNYANKFRLDEVTGELTVRSPPISGRRLGRLKRDLDDEEDSQSAIVMTARAYDLGVPHRWSTTTVHVLPPSANAHTVQFIVNGSRPDLQQTLAILRAVTGGDVRITRVRPYDPRRLELSEMFERQRLPERSIVEATVLYDGKATVDISELQRLLQTNHTAASVAQPVPKPPEDKALFWVLMILSLLIVIAVFLLLLCCACPCCPLYAVPKKNSRVSTAEDLRVLVNGQGRGMETKGVQAEWMSARREAWSGDQKAEHWHFNRRNHPHREAGSGAAVALDDRRGDPDQHLTAAAAARGPAVVYSRELQQLQRSYDRRRDVFLEDVDDAGEYHVLDVRRTRDRDADSDSLRQHEAERGSDLGRPLQAVASPESRREQLYFREGDAEILRLVTRGRSADEGPVCPQQRPATNVPAARHECGKEILMQRFMEDQRNSASDNQEAGDGGARRQQLLLRRLLEEEARQGAARLLLPGDHETQSLPGQASMATQTDVDSSTQTDPLCLMRPPRRRAKSDNDESYTDEDDQPVVAVDGADGGWPTRRKAKRRRPLRYRGEVKVKRGMSTKRHKIKTPIIEETESALEAVGRPSSNSKSKESSESNETHSENNHETNNASKVLTTAGEVEVSELKETKMTIQTQSHVHSASMEEENYHQKDTQETVISKDPENEKMDSVSRESSNNAISVNPEYPQKYEDSLNLINQEAITSEVQHAHLDNKQLITAHDDNLTIVQHSDSKQQIGQSNAMQHEQHYRRNDDSNHLSLNDPKNDRSFIDEYRGTSSHDIDMKYEADHYYREDNRRDYSKERSQRQERRPRSRSRRMPDDRFWYDNRSPSRGKYGRIRPHSIDNRYRSGRWNDDDYADARHHYETDREDLMSRNYYDDEWPRGRYRTIPRQRIHNYRKFNSRSHSRERSLRDRQRSFSRERDYYEWLNRRSQSRERADPKYLQRSRSRYREESPRPYYGHHQKSSSRRDLDNDMEWYYGTRNQIPNDSKKDMPIILVTTKLPENIQSKDVIQTEIISPHILDENGTTNIDAGQASKFTSQYIMMDGRRIFVQAEKSFTEETPHQTHNEAKEEHITSKTISYHQNPQLNDSKQKTSDVETVSTQVSPERVLSIGKQTRTQDSDGDDGSLQFNDSIENDNEVKVANETINTVQTTTKMTSKATGSPVKSRSNSIPASEVAKDEKSRTRQSNSEPGHGGKGAKQSAGMAKSFLQVKEQKPAVLPTKKGSRYMEWYKSKREEREKKKREENENKKNEDEKKKSSLPRSKRNVLGTPVKTLVKEDIPIANTETKEAKTERESEVKLKETESEVNVKKNESVEVEEEKLGELQTLKVSGLFEDDLDSGIAMSSLTAGGTLRRKKHQQLMEKKSIFTIAYDDMHTQQIRADSTSPPY